MATSGVAGLVYARTLVDIGTGDKVDLKDLIAGGGGLQIGTTATTAMAGNKVPTATERGGVLRQQEPQHRGLRAARALFHQPRGGYHDALLRRRALHLHRALILAHRQQFGLRGSRHGHRLAAAFGTG